MRTRPLHILSLVSAVICVGSLLVVGRSFFRVDSVLIPIGQNGKAWATTMYGQVTFGRAPERRGLLYVSAPAEEARRAHEWMWQDSRGIRWLRVGWGANGATSYVTLPLWLLPILTAILPLRWCLLRRRGGARGFSVVPREAGPPRGNDPH